MKKDEKLMKYLGIVSERMRHHHNALWEEEKHYSWWVYIILAGLIYLLISGHFDPPVRFTILVVGSLFGVYLSHTAYKVIRKESEYFADARLLSVIAALAVGLNRYKVRRPEGFIPLIPQLEKDFEDAKKKKGKPNKPLKELLSEARKFNLGIRDFFQLTFFVTKLLFLGLIGLSAYQLSCAYALPTS